MITMVFGLGQALGPYLAGVIADATGSFAAAFFVAGATALMVGGGGSLTLRKGLGRSPQPAAVPRVKTPD
jgi:cyanate permease